MVEKRKENKNYLEKRRAVRRTKSVLPEEERRKNKGLRRTDERLERELEEVENLDRHLLTLKGNPRRILEEEE